MSKNSNSLTTIILIGIALWQSRWLCHDHAARKEGKKILKKFYGTIFFGLLNKFTNNLKAPGTPAGTCLKNASDV